MIFERFQTRAMMATKATAATTMPTIAPVERLVPEVLSAVVESIDAVVAVDEEEVVVEVVVAPAVDGLLLVEVT